MLVERDPLNVLKAQTRMVLVWVRDASAWEDVAPHWREIKAVVRRHRAARRLRMTDRRTATRPGRRLAQRPRTEGILAVLLKLAVLRYRFLLRQRGEAWAVEESWVIGPLIERGHALSKKASLP
jgi:hypothetical protein